VEAYLKELEPLRRRLGLVGGGGFGGGAENVRGRIGQLKGQIMGSTSLPTEVQTRQTAESRALLLKTIESANAMIGKLPGLQKTMAEQGVFPAPPKPIATPAQK
jgi:hypothetical protein